MDENILDSDEIEMTDQVKIVIPIITASPSQVVSPSGSISNYCSFRSIPSPILDNVDLPIKRSAVKAIFEQCASTLAEQEHEVFTLEQQKLSLQNSIKECKAQQSAMKDLFQNYDSIINEAKTHKDSEKLHQIEEKCEKSKTNYVTVSIETDNLISALSQQASEINRLTQTIFNLQTESKALKELSAINIPEETNEVISTLEADLDSLSDQLEKANARQDERKARIDQLNSTIKRLYDLSEAPNQQTSLSAVNSKPGQSNQDTAKKRLAQSHSKKPTKSIKHESPGKKPQIAQKQKPDIQKDDVFQTPKPSLNTKVIKKKVVSHKKSAAKQTRSK